MTTKKELEIEIGEIIYSMDVKFYWTQGEYSRDPTEGTDSTLDDYEITSPIYGTHKESRETWKVTDPDEYEMVEKWIDWENEFELAFI